MASKLGKFQRTFVFWEFVVTTTKFLQKLVVNRTTAANFVALLCHVTGMRTKVQMIDFVVVVEVVVGSLLLETLLLLFVLLLSSRILSILLLLLLFF